LNSASGSAADGWLQTLSVEKARLVAEFAAMAAARGLNVDIVKTARVL